MALTLECLLRPRRVRGRKDNFGFTPSRLVNILNVKLSATRLVLDDKETMLTPNAPIDILLRIPLK